MGIVRKLTGAQAQVDAAKENNRIQEEAARKSSEAAASSAQAVAQAAADQQRNIQERAAIDAEISARNNQPAETVNVAVDAPGANGTGATRRRRASFGRNYDAGTGAKY